MVNRYVKSINSQKTLLSFEFLELNLKIARTQCRNIRENSFQKYFVKSNSKNVIFTIFLPKSRRRSLTKLLSRFFFFFFQEIFREINVVIIIMHACAMEQCKLFSRNFSNKTIRIFPQNHSCAKIIGFYFHDFFYTRPLRGKSCRLI